MKACRDNEPNFIQKHIFPVLLVSSQDKKTHKDTVRDTALIWLLVWMRITPGQEIVPCTCITVSCFYTQIFVCIKKTSIIRLALEVLGDNLIPLDRARLAVTPSFVFYVKLS